MISRPASGCQSPPTASHTSSANSSSVSMKISGEYSKPTIVSSGRIFSAKLMTSSVPAVASSFVAALSLRKTTSRNIGDVALYMWMVARGTPTTLWIVRSMRSVRAWVRTEIVTSSGTAPPSTIERTKSKSVWDAAGKPTSISL